MAVQMEKLVNTLQLEAGGTIIADAMVQLAAGDPGQVTQADATSEILGVAINAGVSGDLIDVAIVGSIKKVIDTAGSLNAGDHVKADAAGKGIVSTTNLDNVVGKCLGDGTTAGDLVPVLVNPIERSIA